MFKRRNLFGNALTNTEWRSSSVIIIQIYRNKSYFIKHYDKTMTPSEYFNRKRERERK